jgi:hypothetical protein
MEDKDDVDSGLNMRVHSRHRLLPLFAEFVQEFFMRLLDAAKGLFRGHKSGSKQPEMPSIFDSGIGDWILDLVVLALVALVVGNVIKWAYVAVFQK